MEAQRAALAACAASELPFSSSSLFSKLSLWKLGGWKHRSPRGCTTNGGRGYAYNLFLGHRRRRFRIGPLVSFTGTTSGDQTSTRHFLAQLLEGEATRLTFCFGSIATASSRQQVRPCPIYCASRRRAVLGDPRATTNRSVSGNGRAAPSLRPMAREIAHLAHPLAFRGSNFSQFLGCTIGAESFGRSG